MTSLNDQSLWLRSESGPVGELQLACGLTEQLCSTAVQFSLVLQPSHKSFYFPQAQTPVLYTAHHLIKESKVTGLVKVILSLHVQQRLINTVTSSLSAYATNPALGFILFFYLFFTCKANEHKKTLNYFFTCANNCFICLLQGISISEITR